MLAKIQLEEKLPKVGEVLTVKWGAKHTDSQRGLYFVFLQFLIDAKLKEWGHYCTAGLHEDMKAVLKEESIAEYNKMEMSEWIEKVNLFAIERFEINTGIFWKDYSDTYGQY